MYKRQSLKSLIYTKTCCNNCHIVTVKECNTLAKFKCISFRVVKAIEYDGPVYIRLGRLAIESFNDPETYTFELGTGITLLDGDDVAVIATGLSSLYYHHKFEPLSGLYVIEEIPDLLSLISQFLHVVDKIPDMPGCQLFSGAFLRRFKNF